MQALPQVRAPSAPSSCTAFSTFSSLLIVLTHLPLADTSETKAHFYCFFLHQTQSKRDGNVREKAWRTLFTLRQVLDVPARRSTQEVGRGVGLAASYTLNIHRFQFRTVSLDAQNGTELPAKSWSSSHRCRYKSACFLRYVVEVSSADVAMVCSDWLWCTHDYGGYG